MSRDFLNNSVNYSECDLVKKILKPILEKYNEHVLKQKSANFTNINEFMIPNNNRKYYMFVMNKSDMNYLNNMYKLLYFFPDNKNEYNYSNKFVYSDFYVEIDNFPKLNKNFLFEGYLYKNINSQDYLITDVLCIDNNVVDVDYKSRRLLINNTISNLTNLNCHLNISIHSVFEINNEQLHLYRIFKNNFIFKSEINAVEHVNNTIKKTKVFELKEITSKKIISKGKFIDVYNVNCIDTNNNNGILYVKTLDDSRKLIKLFKDTDTIELQCVFNNKFNKWQTLV